MFRIAVFFLFATSAFLEASEWSERVYLATFPRSGNHWMRYLIEDATHISTGTVYRDSDPPHLKDPFPWEAFSTDGGYRKDCRDPRPFEPFVVKTHYPALGKQPFDGRRYKAVIRIVRHPVDSFYSWYVYKKGNEQTIPRDLLELMVRKWKRFQEYWEVQPNVTTFRYEDMMLDLKKHVRKTLNVIGYKYTQEDLDYAVEMNQPRGGVLKHLEHFTHDDLQYIQKELGALMVKYNYSIPGVKLK